MVGWNRLPDPRHLIHELLGRTAPSSVRSVIDMRLMQGWLLDFTMQVHDAHPSTPYDPRLTVWDEYALDFCDPDIADAQIECRGELVRVLQGDRSLVRQEYAKSSREPIWTEGRNSLGQPSEGPGYCIERMRDATQGKMDLLLFPPPRIHKANMGPVNTILLYRHCGCAWEKLQSAPEPWSPSVRDLNIAKQCYEDGTWEQLLQPLHIQELEASVAPFPTRRRRMRDAPSEIAMEQCTMSP